MAERSDKGSYSREEVSESFVAALEKDCRREINTAFIDTAWRIFSDPEPSLWRTNQLHRMVQWVMTGSR